MGIWQTDPIEKDFCRIKQKLKIWEHGHINNIQMTTSDN